MVHKGGDDCKTIRSMLLNPAYRYGRMAACCKQADSTVNSVKAEGKRMVRCAFLPAGEPDQANPTKK